MICAATNFTLVRTTETYFTTGRTIGTLKFHSPTNGKNRRSTNHCKTDTAFRKDDHMSVDTFFVS